MTATGKQMTYLGDLLQERELDDDMRAALERQIANGLSAALASSFIDLLSVLPRSAEGERKQAENTERRLVAKAKRPTVPGRYQHPVTGEIVRVAISKKGYPYALREEGGEERYISGLISELDASMRADDESALGRVLAQVAARA